MVEGWGGGFYESRRMNEYQAAHFTVGASLVAACFILGLIITELLRKLAKERETVERLRRMASKSYSHRKCLEDAVFEYLTATESRTLAKTLKRLEEQAKWSKEDHD